MALTVTPVDATLGAVVTDVDLASLDDAAWKEIHGAFLTYGVLIFPGQALDAESQGAFARRFGRIEQMSSRQTGGTVQFSNQKPDGTLLQPNEERYRILKGNEGWHTDSTYMPLAAKASMLMALVVPPTGGETEFADMRAAYDALDEDTQRKLEGLSAHHSLYYSQERVGYKHATDNLYGFHDKGAPLRPIIKTHPETGRKSIYTGRHAYGIPGMAPAHLPAPLDRGRPGGLGQPLPDAPRPALQHGLPAGTARVPDLRRAGDRVGAHVRRSAGDGVHSVIFQRVIGGSRLAPSGSS